MVKVVVYRRARDAMDNIQDFVQVAAKAVGDRLRELRSRASRVTHWSGRRSALRQLLTGVFCKETWHQVCARACRGTQEVGRAGARAFGGCPRTRWTPLATRSNHGFGIRRSRFQQDGPKPAPCSDLGPLHLA